jgi:hypothetical protein
MPSVMREMRSADREEWPRENGTARAVAALLYSSDFGSFGTYAFSRFGNVSYGAFGS